MRDRANRAAYQAAWYVANREKILASRAAYYAANREQVIAYQAVHRAANIEKVRIREAAYSAAHRDDKRSYHTTWRKANPKKIAVIQAAYRAANLEKIAAYQVAYRRANPDAALAWVHRRRARKAGNGGTYTAAEWREKCALLGNLCIYCGEAKRLTVDHKTPLFRGGTNDIANIVPACRSCNSRKGNKTAAEFLAMAA